MPNVRSELTYWAEGDPPEDYCTATVYHTIGAGIVWGQVDWDNHAQEVLDCFTGNAANHTTTTILYRFRHCQLRVYDMGDAKPRPIKSQKTFTPGSADGAESLGPRQVALCMSYYGSRNLPHERGRVYMGPFTAAALLARPSAALQGDALHLGEALFDVGGQNVAWAVHSEKQNTYESVTTIWCNDSWDTQRRRNRKETSRVTNRP